MSRRGFVWVLVLVLLGALTFGQAQPQPEPYKQINEFAQVLHHVLKRYVDEPSVDKLMEGAIQGMLGTLDPHSSYFNKKESVRFRADTEGKFGGLGIEIGLDRGILTVFAPIHGTPAWEAGIMPGDKILKIEGKSTKGISTREAVEILRGKPGTRVTITVQRQNSRLTEDITITRGIIKIPILHHRMVDEEAEIGHIRAHHFTSTLMQEFDKAMDALQEQGMKALVLDLRGNPGGILQVAVALADRFLDNGVIVTVRGRKKTESHAYKAKEAGAVTDLPLVVLIDEGSASASEIVAAALRDNGRCILVGQRTYGKGSVQKLIPLGDGKELKLTTAYYYTPAGKRIEDRKGIEPDVSIYMSLQRRLDLRNQEREDKLRDVLAKKNGDTEDTNTPPNPKTGEDMKRRERVEDIQIKGAITLLKVEMGKMGKKAVVAAIE